MSLAQFVCIAAAVHNKPKQALCQSVEPSESKIKLDKIGKTDESLMSDVGDERMCQGKHSCG